MDKMDKFRLFRQIEVNIKEQIAGTERARQDAQAEANKHKGKMQSRYDTFKEEAQQLATAHELRRIELTKELSALRKFLDVLDPHKTGFVVVVGSLVTIESLDGQRHWSVLLSPVGGGLELTLCDDKITVVTPSAPLGQALLGKFGGEKIRLVLDRKTMDYAISEVF